MPEFNPYEVSSAEISGRQEEELLDPEARFRIAKALEASRTPTLWLSTLTLLLGVVLMVPPAFALLTSVGRHSRFSRQLIEGLLAGSFPFVFGIAIFSLGLVSWSLSQAISRACQRLTIASLSAAVEMQCLFWKKAARWALICLLYCVVVTVIVIVMGRR
ncbi:MAG: hypothetical protein R3C49_08910 [Planctomycetaceae bacterium]